MAHSGKYATRPTLPRSAGLRHHGAMDVRPSPLTGKWYPADAADLAREVDRHLDGATTHPAAGNILGVVAPHAGMRFSGPVAGHSFNATRGLDIDLAALIGPSHYASPHPLLTCGHDAFETPLGRVPVEREAVDALNEHLQERLGFGLTPVRKDPEHSLEMELPFLQRALDDFAVLPVVIVEQTPEICRSVGQALAEVVQNKKALLVASSDLSHFHHQTEAVRLDEEMLRRVGDFDPDAVMTAEDEGVGYACGRGAIAATFWAARELGATKAHVLKHATSGDVTGDFSSVVGYGTAAIG